jgi:hypothetical protein
MFLSAVSVLVVAQPISEVPEGLTNYPVLSKYEGIFKHTLQIKVMLNS